MIDLKRNLINQIRLFKQDIVQLVHNYHCDIKKIDILDLYKLNNLIHSDNPANYGEIVINFQSYRIHPYKEIDIDKVLNCLKEEQQINVSEIVRNPKIVKCSMPGPDKSFGQMLENNINKNLMILPNFNLPASDSSYVIPENVIKKLPTLLYPTILEINNAYLSGLNIACGILLRRLIEGAILLKYTQLDRLDSLKNGGDYIGLEKMVNTLFTEKTLTFPKGLRVAVLNIKWLGDKGAHNFELEIFRNDVQSNLIRIREFLELLKLIK